MFSFLVTGANGFIGRYLVAALIRRGFAVKQAVRCPGQACGPVGEVHAVGDIGPDTDWDSALDRIDVVVHLAARVHCLRDRATDPVNEFRNTNVLATERLARRSAAKGVRRLVYLSSIGVNGKQNVDGAFTERDPPSPHDAYTTSKWEAEKILGVVTQQTGLETVILRPPLVYGPGNPGNFLRLLNLVSSGWPLPLRAFSGRRSLVFAGNLVDAIILCATHPDAAGHTYLVRDGEDISTSELVQRLATLMGRSSRLFSFPPSWLRRMGALTGKVADVDRLLNPLLVDDSRIRAELGWRPPYSLADGLRETVTWFVAGRQAP
jgi:nucleoside-diphosphate-sugar epimerase